MTCPVSMCFDNTIQFKWTIAFCVGLTLIVSLTMIPDSSMASQVKYVTDQLKVNMRAGTSTSHKIVESLISGHQVKILNEKVVNGYIQVLNENDKTGYILSRFLVDEPGAKELLKRADTQLQQLQQTPERLRTELGKLKKRFQTLQVSNKKTVLEKSNLQIELEEIRQTLNKPLEVAAERNLLRTQVAKLIRQNEEIKQDKLELENSTNYLWFLLGGGAIVLGLILGLILPNLQRRQRRPSWNSL